MIGAQATLVQRIRRVAAPGLGLLALAFAFGWGPALGCAGECEPPPSGCDCNGGQVCELLLDGGGETCGFVAPDVSFRAALHGGFSIADFGDDRVSLERGNSSVAAELSWTLSERVQSVACGLFLAPPLVYAAKPAEDSATSCTVREIENYESVVLADEKFTGPSGAFGFGSIEAIETSETIEGGQDMSEQDEGAQVDPEPKGPRIPKPACTVAVQLSVGCWAYDDFSLFAASELIPLSPQELHPVLRDELNYVEDCAASADSDGRLCELASGDMHLGVCYDELCRARCKLPADCDRLVTVLDETTIDDPTATTTEATTEAAPELTPEFRCETLAADACGIGVCVPTE